MRAIGFDIGGTALKAGAIDADGGNRVETSRETGPDTDLERLIDASLARGTNVVLVSYPMTGGYLRTAQALGVPHPATLPEVQRLLSRPNVRHLDHSADFVGMPHLFWDGDHLNAAGRKALTTALRQELIATR